MSPSVGAHNDVTLPSGRVVSVVEVGAVDGDNVAFYFHGTPSSRMEATARLPEPAAERGLRVIAPDRPGCGRSDFTSYRVADYPTMVSELADTFGLDRFGVIGVSGGGRYACACASQLGPRVTAVVLVASTASPELPGVKDALSRKDRVLYGMANRAPWLLAPLLRKVARDVRKSPDAIVKLFGDVPPVDRAALEDPEVVSVFQSVFAEALRAGPRGVIHDLRLESRPWGVELSRIEVPVHIWHGTEDAIVPFVNSEALGDAIPTAIKHAVQGEGHLSLRVNRMDDVLDSLSTSA